MNTITTLSTKLNRHRTKQCFLYYVAHAYLEFAAYSTERNDTLIRTPISKEKQRVPYRLCLLQDFEKCSQLIQVQLRNVFNNIPSIG
jgi:hypothetical protein